MVRMVRERKIILCGHQLTQLYPLQRYHTFRRHFGSSTKEPKELKEPKERNNTNIGGLEYEGKTYFELLDLPLNFRVDLAVLEANYKKLQRLYHPDRFAMAGQHEQDQAQSLAARLNEAVDTLKTPYSRAVYLLEQNGANYGEESKTISDPGMLGKVMESRFAIEEAVEDNDLAAIHRLHAENEAEFDSVVEQLAMAFERGLASGDLTEAVEITACLSYLRTIQEEINKHRTAE